MFLILKLFTDSPELFFKAAREVKRSSGRREKKQSKNRDKNAYVCFFFVAIPPHNTVCKWRIGDFYAEIRTRKNKVCCAGDEGT